MRKKTKKIAFHLSNLLSKQKKKKKKRNPKIKKERGGFLNLLFAGRNEPSE